MEKIRLTIVIIYCYLEGDNGKIKFILFLLEKIEEFS